MWREILEGKTVREALGDEDDGEHLDALLRPVLDGEPTEFEWVGRRSGARLHVQAVPVRDDRAGVIGVMAVCRDITPRARRPTPRCAPRAPAPGRLARPVALRGRRARLRVRCRAWPTSRCPACPTPWRRARS